MSEAQARNYSLCLLDRFPESFLPEIATTLEATLKMVRGESEVELARKNAEYTEKLERSFNPIKDGQSISFTIDELESFETMLPEEISAFAEKRRAGLV